MALNKQPARIRNKEERSRAQKRYYEKTKESRKKIRSERTATWLAANPEYHRQYRKANKGIINAKTAKRRAKKKRATPSWLTKTHFDQMRLFYKSAAALTKELGIKFEVDHIIPLQGKNVKGLHVPWNLQCLPLKDNRIKGNGIK